MLKHVRYIVICTVLDFSTLFSDIHTPLSLTINNYVEMSSDNNTHIDGEEKI